MLRAVGRTQMQGLRQANLGQAFTDLLVYIDTPVLRYAQVTPRFVVRAMITPCESLNIQNDPTLKDYKSYVAVNIGTPRLAKSKEVEVKLWHSGGGTAILTSGITGSLTLWSGPEITDGGWKLVLNQPTMTDADGQVRIGDPAWVSPTGEIGKYLTQADYPEVWNGWVRVVATHVATGFQTAKRVKVENGVPNPASLSFYPVLMKIGPTQPPTFTQLGHLQRYWYQNRQ